MRRRVLAALLAITLMTPVMSDPLPVAAAGFCGSDQGNNLLMTVQPLNESGVPNSTGNWFDLATGLAKAQDIEICIGANAGSFVLPVNVDFIGEHSGHGFQMGSGKPGPWLKFVYADWELYPIELESPTPIVGHLYLYKVLRDATSHPDYSIKDMTAGGTTIWSKTNSTAIWYGDADQLEWMYETLKFADHHGGECNQDPQDLAYQAWMDDLGYSTDTHASTSFVNPSQEGDVLAGDWDGVNADHTTMSFRDPNWWYACVDD